jgi:hypothetical protein
MLPGGRTSEFPASLDVICTELVSFPRKHSDSSLPPMIRPADASTFRQSVLIDARAIVQSVREVLSGR